MAELELPTGEVIEFPDDRDPQEVADWARENFLSPRAIPESVIGAMIRVESAGKPDAVSGKGNIGLLQIHPDTATQPGFGISPITDPRSLFDPDTNVGFGSKYLAKLYEKYGDLDDALAAYNWGPGAMDTWIANGRDQNKMPGETRNYIGRVGAVRGGISDPREPQAKTPDFQPLTQIGRGFASGLPLAAAIYSKGVEVAADVLGWPEMADRAQSLFQQYIAESQKAAPLAVDRFSKAESVTDYLNWAAGQAGVLAPQVIPTIALGALSLVASGPVTAAAVGGLGANALLQGVGSVGAELESKGIKGDTQISVGQALRNFGVEPPKDLSPLLDTTMVSGNDLALAFGIPTAAIEVAAGPERIALKVLRGKAVGKVLGVTLGSMAGEAGEEFAQQYVANAAVQAATGASTFTMDNLRDAFDAAASGAIGGLIGGPPIALMGKYGESGKETPITSQTQIFKTPFDGLVLQTTKPDGTVLEATIQSGIKVGKTGELMLLTKDGYMLPIKDLVDTKTRDEAVKDSEFEEADIAGRILSDTAPKEAAPEVTQPEERVANPAISSASPLGEKGFYDPILRQLEKATITSGTKDRWLKYLHGAGADETYLDLLGIKDYLEYRSLEIGKQPGDKNFVGTGISKEDLIETIRSRQLYVTEDVQGKSRSEEKKKELIDVLESYGVSSRKIEDVIYAIDTDSDTPANIAQHYAGFKKNNIHYNVVQDAIRNYSVARPAPFSHVTLAESVGVSTKNYKMLHISVPHDSSSINNTWMDGHSGINVPNPVVRIRFSDATVGSEKVLHIDEVQPPTKSNFAKMPKFLQDRWASLGFKRALLWAVQNGYDRVTWTTGKQQIDRYNLKQQIRGSATYNPSTKSIWLGQTWFPTVDFTNNPLVKVLQQPLKPFKETYQYKYFQKHPEEVDPQSRNMLPDTLVQELLPKAGEEYIVLEKDWPKRLYDDQLSGIARKMGKRFKAPVEDVDIALGTDNERNPVSAKVHSMRITPEMRGTLLRTGLPFTQLTAKAQAHEDDLKALLVREVKRMAPTANVVFLNEAPLTGRQGDTDLVAGGFQSGSLIAFALGHADIGTVYHEVQHLLERIGAFNPEKHQLELLDKNKDKIIEFVRQELDTRGTPKDIADAILNEMDRLPQELRAYGSEFYARARLDGRQVNLQPKSFFEKIAQFFMRLRNALNKLGFQTWQDVFEEVHSGRVGANTLDTTLSEPVANLAVHEAAAMMHTTPEQFERWYKGSVLVDSYGRPTPLFYDTTQIVPEAALVYEQMGPVGAGVYLSPSPEGDQTGLVLAKIKNPYYTNTPLGEGDKEYLLDVFKQARELLSEPQYNMMRELLASAKYPQDLIDNDYYILSSYPALLATHKGHDAVLYNDPYTRKDGWLFLGDKGDIRALVPEWNNVNFSIAVGPPTNLNYQTPKDLNKLFTWILTPSAQARMNKYFAPVYITAETLHRTRSIIAAEAYREAAPYAKLHNTQMRRVDAVRELARLQGLVLKPNSMGNIVVANNLLNRTANLSEPGDVITLEGKEVEAYLGLSKAANHLWDSLIVSMMFDNPDIGTNLQGFDAIPWNPNFTPEELAAIAEDLKQRAIDLKDDAVLQERYLAEAARVKGIHDTLVRMQIIKNQWDYVPFVRFGEWAFILEDPDTGETLWMETFKGTWSPKGSRIPKGKIEARYRELKDRFPNAVLKENDDGSQVFKLTHDSVMRLVGNPLMQLDFLVGQLSDASASEYEKIRGHIETLIKQRGFAHHLENAKNIPGYSTDFRRAWGNYIIGAAGFAARQMWGRKLRSTVTDIPPEATNILRSANKYYDYIMSPQEELSFLRGLSFTFYLGGNISTALIQLANLPIYSAPQLAQVTSVANAHKEVLRASRQTMGIYRRSIKKYLGGKIRGRREHEVGMTVFDPTDDAVVANLTPEERQIVRAAWDEGILKPVLMGSQVGLPPTIAEGVAFKSLNTWQEAQTILSAAFGQAESFARIAHLLAAYRVAKKVGMPKIDNLYRDDNLWQAEVAGRASTPYDFARYQVNRVMGQFDKTNRPLMGRGVGTMVFQFQTWTQQILETLAIGFVQQGAAGKKAFALSSLWLIALAGFWGLPGADDIRKAAEAIWQQASGNKVNFDTEMREMLVALPWLEEKTVDYLMRGGMRAFGVDVSQRVGIGRLPGSNILGAILGDQEAFELAGPIGSMGLGNIQAMKMRMESGEPLFDEITVGGVSGVPVPAAAREMLPLFLRNFVDSAIWWNTTGYSTRRGQVVVPPEKISWADRATRTIGFMPTDIARESEARLKQREEELDTGREGVYRGRLTRIASSLLYAHLKQDPKKAEQASREWNRTFEEIRQHNASAKPEDLIIIDMAGIMRNAMLNYNPDMRAYVGTPVQKRERLKQLRELHTGEK